jgi:adenylylsulfate kinase-like enzyme
MIILLFGQPASGKTTLAKKLEKNYILSSIFYGKLIKIDGDKWREITENKNYTKEGRITNMMSAFNMALYLESEGYTPILSFVTPYEVLRNHLLERAKQLCPIYLQYNENRGRNEYFAKDFEEPKLECLKIDTSLNDIDNCISVIIDYVSLNYEKKTHT